MRRWTALFVLLPWCCIGLGDTFYVLDSVTDYSFSPVEATMKMDGDYCKIWWDDAIAEDPNKVTDIREAFDFTTPVSGIDLGIYQLLTQAYGASVPDIDENGEVYILITELPPGVYGYFFSYDQVPDEGAPGPDSYMIDGEEIWSNHADIVYISATLASGAPGYETEGVIAHEFQHLLHFGADPFEATWLNEGLSQYAMYVCGFGHDKHTLLQGQIQSYFDGANVPLTQWSGMSSQYGCTYLWFLYLHDRFDADTGSWVDDHDVASSVFRSNNNGIFSVSRSVAFNGDGNSLGRVFSEWGLANLLIGNVAPLGGALPLELLDTEYTSLPQGVYQMKPTAQHQLGAADELGPRNAGSWYYTNQYVSLKRTGGGEMRVGFDGQDEDSLLGKYRLHFARRDEASGQVQDPEVKDLTDASHTTWDAGPDPYVASPALASDESLIMVVSVDSKGAYDLGFGGYIYWTGERPLIITYPGANTIINDTATIRWTPAQASLIAGATPDDTELDPSVHYRLECSDEVQVLDYMPTQEPKTYLVIDATQGSPYGATVNTWAEREMDWDAEPDVEIDKLSSYPAPAVFVPFEEDFEGKLDWMEGGWIESHPAPCQIVDVAGDRKGLIRGDTVNGDIVTVKRYVPTPGLIDVSLSFDWEANIDGGLTDPFWAVSLSYDNGSTWEEIATFGMGTGFYGEVLPTHAFNNTELWIEFSIWVPGGAGGPNVDLLLDNIEIVGSVAFFRTIWGEHHFLRAHEVTSTGLPAGRDGVPLPGGVFSEDRWSYSDRYNVFHYDPSLGSVVVIWTSHEDFEGVHKIGLETVPATPPVNEDDGRLQVSGGPLGEFTADYLRVDGVPEGVGLIWRVDEATYNTADPSFAEFQVRYTEETLTGTTSPDWSQGSGWAGPDDSNPGAGNEAAQWWQLPDGTAGDLGGGERQVNLDGVVTVSDVFYIQWRARLHNNIVVKDVTLALSKFGSLGYDVNFSQFDPPNGTCLVDETVTISCMVALDVGSLDVEDVFAGAGFATGDGDMGFEIDGVRVPGNIVGPNLLEMGDNQFRFISQDPLGINPSHPYMGMMVANLHSSELPAGGYVVQPFVTTINAQRKECEDPWYFYVDRETPRCDFSDYVDDFLVPGAPEPIEEIPVQDANEIWAYPCNDAADLMIDDEDEDQYYALNIYHTADYELLGYADDTKRIPDDTSSIRPQDPPYQSPDPVGLEYIEVGLERIGLATSTPIWADVEDWNNIGATVGGESYLEYLCEWSKELDFVEMGPSEPDERQGFYLVWTRATDQCGNQTPESEITGSGDPLGDPWGKIRLLYDIEMPTGQARFNAAPYEDPVNECMESVHVSARSDNVLRPSSDLQLELEYHDNVSDDETPGEIGVQVIFDAKARISFDLDWDNAPELPDLNPEYPKNEDAAEDHQWKELREPDLIEQCALYTVADLDTPGALFYDVDFLKLFDESMLGVTIDVFIWYKDEAGNVSSSDANAHPGVPIDHHLTVPDPVPYVATIHMDNVDPGLTLEGSHCVEPYQPLGVDATFDDQGDQSWGTPTEELCINVQVNESSSVEPTWLDDDWISPGSPYALASVSFEDADVGKTFYIWVKARDKAGNEYIPERPWYVKVQEDCEGEDSPGDVSGWGSGEGNKVKGSLGEPQTGKTRLFYWRMD